MSGTNNRKPGFLRLTFTSVATAGVSAYLAVADEAAAAYPSVADQAVLATSVAVSTFLAAKLGKKAGCYLGMLGGASGARRPEHPSVPFSPKRTKLKMQGLVLF